MKILLVEDEPGLVRVLTDLLKERGYQVKSCLTGEAGFETAAKEVFDIILLDVMLPGIDGFEVCQSLRRAGIRTPILMLTARGEILDKLTAFEGGADDYVTKPYDSDELLARIGALVRRATFSSAAEMRTFEFDGRQVDFVKAQVTHKGQTVDLSERESRLLRYFVEHKGEIVTRDTLLQEVWGYNAVPFTRTVDVHIVWLRQKIEEDSKNPRYILTVHGQGYRFSV